MASKSNPTHTAVHTIQYYDTKFEQMVEVKAGSEFDPKTVNSDIDWAKMEKSGAIKKIAKGTSAPAAPQGEEESDEFDTILDNNVGDVEEAIYAEPRDKDWLATLRAREVKGKNRVGVIEAIDGYEVEGDE